MVFVTGGSGYLGSQLICTLLNRGERIIALKRPSSNLSPVMLHIKQNGLEIQREKQLSWVDGDLLNSLSLSENIPAGSIVYHCAAQVSFSAKDLGGFTKVNTLGTANLVDACLEKGASRLCFASTIGSIGKAEDGHEATEADLWDEHGKHSNYSKSKYLAELEVFRGIAEGLPAVIINPSVLTGPGIRGNSFEKLIELVSGGLKFFPPGSNAWVDVRDVAQAMVTLATNNNYSGRYIVSAENLSYRDILKMIAHFLQLPEPKRLSSKTTLRIASFLNTIKTTFSGQQNPLSYDMIRIICGTSSYSSEAFIKETSIRFTPIQKSIEDAVTYYRNICQY